MYALYSGTRANLPELKCILIDIYRNNDNL